MRNIFESDYDPEADHQHKDCHGEKGLQAHLLLSYRTPHRIIPKPSPAKGDFEAGPIPTSERKITLGEMCAFNYRPAYLSDL
jgi:hypothetical protein